MLREVKSVSGDLPRNLTVTLFLLQISGSSYMSNGEGVMLLLQLQYPRLDIMLFSVYILAVIFISS